METPRSVRLSLVLLLVVVFSGYAASKKCIRGRCDGKKSIPEWDFLLFVNEWPQSYCMFYNASSSHHTHGGCVIPNNVNNWTIHGTWPTKYGTEGPTSCNKTWTFDLDKIKDLVPTMTTVWPGLHAGTKDADFWGHEWTKHGTCAASLPALKGEHNYFDVSLQLNEKISLFSILSKAGIVPSDSKEYSYDDIKRAIQIGLGTSSDLICYQSTGNSGFRQYLVEVRFCVDKSLKPMDCPKSLHKSAFESPCSQKTTIGLPIIKH